MLACPAEHIGRCLSTTGVYDLAVSELMFRLVQHGDVVVDAGAREPPARLVRIAFGTSCSKNIRASGVRRRHSSPTRGYTLFAIGWSMRRSLLAKVRAGQSLSHSYEAPSHLAIVDPNAALSACRPSGWLALRRQAEWQ